MNRIVDRSISSRAKTIKRRIAIRGAEIAVFGEDSGAIDKLGEDLVAEMQPQTTIGLLMIEQIVLATVRTRRCARHERALISRDARDAGAKFDDARLTEVEKQIGWILAEPETNARKLQMTHEGTDRLLKEWAILLDDLVGYIPSQWSHTQGQMAEALMGSRDYGMLKSRFYQLTDCLRGNFNDVTVAAFEGMDKQQKMDWARDRIRDIIQAEVARLQEVRKRFDPNDLAESRADATDMAVFSNSIDAIAARKYLIACNRMFLKCFEGFYKFEGPARLAEPVDATPEPETTSEPLASFCPGAEPDPASPTEPLASFCPGDEPAPASPPQVNKESYPKPADSSIPPSQPASHLVRTDSRRL